MTEPSSNRPRIAPLPVVRQGFVTTAAGFDALLRIGWLPALLMTAAGALLEPQAPYIDAQGEIVTTPQAMFVFILLALLATALSTMVATTWQRMQLMPAAEPPRRWYLRLGRRELLYMLVSFFLLGLVFMGLATAPGAAQAFAAGQAVGGIVLLIGPVVATIVVARSVMVLPAIALDRGADIARAWRAAEGNTLRIAIALVLVTLPILAGELLMLEVSAAVIGTEPGLVVELVLRFVKALVSFVLAAPAVAVTGVLYVLLIDPDLGSALSRPANRYFAV
ncbi:MAG: hypothetical protein O3B22_00195 [Proteobacteria bacterium]|nr:hypothetical protein [Pseudomonadota bacterium]MDA1071087.1 hypothetical protein [Pseudomonadota bacterium]